MPAEPGPLPPVLLPPVLLPLVLLPGFMTDATLWRDLRPLLEPALTLVDGDLFQDEGVEAMAARVLATVPGRFGVLGFSMGGYVARAMARQAPGRVARLVLAATSARADTPEQARRKHLTARRIGTQPHVSLSRRAIATALHPDRAGDAALVEHIRAMGVRLGPAVFARQSAPRGSDADRLGAITCPTLVVAAAQDALRSLPESEELRDGIPGARLVVIEACGHMIPLEQPATLARHVLAWVAADRRP